MSVRTSAGVYTTNDPARDQRGLPLLLAPPVLLLPPRCSPTRNRVKARMNRSMTDNYGYYMRGSLPPRSLCGNRFLGLCI